MDKVAQKSEFNLQMILLDLDGTLLNKNKKIGQKDIETLEYLQKKGICNVFATGRNLFSAKKVIPDNISLDYLVFSSGAGIIDWKTKEIIFKSTLNNQEIKNIESILRKQDVNFTIQLAIPDNHKYYFYRASNKHTDFETRNNLYKNYCFKLDKTYPLKTASQFIVILQTEEEFNQIKSKLNDFKVIRATSPLDNKSIWLEIVANNVSKAEGGKRICKILNIPEKNTLSIGNDYNDIDLLNWTDKSFVVNNSPNILKQQFTVCTDNNNNPLTQIIQKKGFI